MKRAGLLVGLLCIASAVAWAVTDMSASKINAEALLESSELRASKIVGLGVLESSELRASKIVGLGVLESSELRASKIVAYALLESGPAGGSRGYIFGANDNWPRVLIKEDRCEIAA